MIIHRYLIKEICTTLLATTLILLLVFISNQFVRYLQYAANGAISSNTVALLLLLQLPYLLSLVLPVSLFMSIILAYGRLHCDHEMVILSACGVGPDKILKITLLFSAIIALIVAMLSLFVAPKVSRYVDQIFAGKTSSILELVIPNKFQSINKGKWVYYVEKVSGDKSKLFNVFAAELPSDSNSISKKPQGVLFAKSGYKKKTSNEGIFLVLTDGYRYSGIPGQKNYQIAKYDEYGVRLQQAAGDWQPDESDSGTIALWKDRDNIASMTELQWRLSLPISVFILTLVGVPLGKVRLRHGRYAQLVPAILCYVAYAQLLFLNRAWMKKGVITPLIGTWWVHFIMLLLALLLLERQMHFRKQFFLPKKPC